MTQEEQAAAFEEDLDKLLDRYAEEFDLPICMVIGILHLKIHEITVNAYEDDEVE